MSTEKSATLPPSQGAAPRETLTPRSAIHGNVAFDCGWGRLVFGQTFAKASDLAECLRAERPGQRDIAFYVLDPHVVLAAAPQELFLDPSHTYRLELDKYVPAETKPRGFHVRRLNSLRDAEEINRIYAARRMVTVAPNFFWEHRDDDAITYFVAVDDQTGAIVGTVTGVDHKAAFGDMENGSSLWCLAVDTQSTLPGIGEALVRRLSEHFKEHGCAYMDLSVLHDNKLAIALYEKLGFIRWATFTVKHKNVINENLFTETSDEYDVLNPYARIIVDEAQRRGIGVDIIDAEGGFFRLTHGGRSVTCRESLTSLTTAIAMSVCDDKRVTRRIVEAGGVRVPRQITVEDEADAKAFVEHRDAVVVKPARGEQGKGVAVGLKNWADAKAAIDYAKTICNDVIVEDFVEGVDLRIVVINYRVVAAAIRKPATIAGNGKSTVRELIERQTRRRLAATGGESAIPMDAETERCLAAAGFRYDDIPAADESIVVRKTANLHTGGTIHDVTGILHPALIDAAVAAARAIEIPVTGIDFIVKTPTEPDYWFIEANERPGLANHEPQPTAARFVDMLFPQTVPAPVRKALQI
ncbi:N-acetylglutaminylglutamine synthetase [Methyloceanibacter sp.]|uniref:N-acetylglutaminylglutamine synthetase n=1 Tax=Methyloceanibacter sp. TaxID=1965321 RepID=UPI002B8BD926|nr:N-acetylglutaminylglutamine synthetase [Methyloceanibacter sp.]HML91541.1 N-acetylglutaminylglutamine synthetase [Methyloceanibacter sp.]